MSGKIYTPDKTTEIPGDPNDAANKYGDVTGQTVGTSRGQHVYVLGSDVVTSPGQLSTANSTADTLTAGGTFVGTWEEITNYASFAVNAVSDVPSAVNSFIIQFSSDGTNVDDSVPYSLLADDPQSHTFVSDYRYFRVSYTNGDTDQSAFRLQSLLHRNRSATDPGGVEILIRRNADAPLSRVVNDNNVDRNLGLLNAESVVQVQGFHNAVTSTEEMVGDDGVLNWPEAGEPLRIRSGGSSNDDASGTGARKIKIYGLTDGYSEASETLDTAGTAASGSTSTTFFRPYLAEVEDAGSYTGANDSDILIEGATTSDLYLTIKAGLGRSQFAGRSIPSNKTAYLKNISIDGESDEPADVFIYQRPDINVTAAPYSAKKLIKKFPKVIGQYNYTFSAFPVITQRSDIWATAKRRGQADAELGVSFDLLIKDRDPALIFNNEKSIYGDGSNAYSLIGDDATLDFTNAMTIGFWMKCPNNGFKHLLSKAIEGDAATSAWYIYNNGSGNLGIDLFNTSAAAKRYRTVATDIFNDTWKHVCITWANNDLKIYINAIEPSLTKVIDTALTNIDTNDEAISVLGGALSSSGNYATSRMQEGYVDELFFANVTFTADEVAEVYNRGIPENLSDHSQYANVVSWYRGDGDTAPTVTDRKGSNNMTLFGNASIESEAP